MRIDVWFVMLPGVLSLDMTGPAETFVWQAMRFVCITLVRNLRCKRRLV